MGMTGRPAPSTASSPEMVWDAVLARVAEKPSMSWVKHLALRRIEGAQAHLLAVSGGRELIQFVTGPRREQLAELLKQVLGRPVRIEIAASSPESGSSAAASPNINGPRPPGAKRAAVSPSDWQKALTMPLVKQVLDVFDAAIVSIEPERPAAAEVAHGPQAGHAAVPPAAESPLFPTTPSPLPDDESAAEDPSEDHEDV